MYMSSFSHSCFVESSFLPFFFLCCLSVISEFFVTFEEENNPTSDGKILKWDKVDFDPGYNYNPATGGFTAPITGTYV